MSEDTGSGEASSSADLGALLNDAIEAKRKFDEFIASSTSVVNQMLEKARSDASEVDKLKTEVASLKGGIETVQQAASSELGIIAQAKADIEKYKSGTKAISERVEKRLQETSEKISALELQEGEFQNVLKSLSAIKTEAEAEKDAARESVQEIERAKTKFDELNAETTTRHDELGKNYDALSAKIEEIAEAHTKIKLLRKQLLETTGDELSVEDEIEKLKVEIDTLLGAIKKDRSDAQSDFNTFKEAAQTGKTALFEDLEKRILALLPSAGAAGLASTYYDAKSRYAPTSYAGRPGKPALVGWRKWLRICVGNNPASALATGFFYALFLVPLGALVWGTYDLIWQLEHNTAFKFDYRVVVLRFLIAVPLATASGFGFASLQLYRKLYEEYNHKQRVMELYISFRDEIEKAGDQDQIKMLLKIMMDSVADKAWRDAKVEPKDEMHDALMSVDKVTSLVAKIKTLGV